MALRGTSLRMPTDSAPSQARPWGFGAAWLAAGLACASGVWAEAPAQVDEPVAATAPEATLPQMPGVESLLRVTGSLTLVILAVVLAAWLLRRVTRTQARNGTGLRVIGGLAVGSRERVVLIEAGTTRMLLGVAPGQVSTLHVFEQGRGSGGATPTAGAEFAERLDALLQPEKGP